MRHDILLPALGDVTSGEVADWYWKSGDRVTAGEPVVAVDVDKTTIDVPSVATGLLTIAAEPGTEVQVGGLLGWVTDD